VAAGGPLGPVQLHHLLGLALKEPGQASAVAAGAFDRPDPFARLAGRHLQQLLVAGWGGRHGHLGEDRAGGGGHDRGGVGVLVGVDPDDELDDLCQHRHGLTPWPDVDVDGMVRADARQDGDGTHPTSLRVVRLLHQASSAGSGPHPAAVGGHVRCMTPPGSVIPRVTPAATGCGSDHHRTTGQSHSHSTQRYSACQERTCWIEHRT
jgi:hypothetical protein